MAELKGTNVAAGIVPFTSEDKYATHDAKYGKGGFRSVDTIAERDAIPTERKTNGMIVHVTENGLNYEWKNNAWVEWLPKGNVTVDAALNTTSNNAVANKAATAGINEAKAAAAAAQAKADAAIPKANIIQDVAAAMASEDKVPSAKAVHGMVISTSTNLQNLIKTAQNKADAAIPKANITQDVEANKTREDLVPSVKAVNDAIDGKIADIPEPVVDTALNSSSTNPVQNKVINGRIVAIETVVAAHNTSISELEADHAQLDREVSELAADVLVNKNNLAPIKTAWDKKNAANGLVQLDGSAKLPASVLPAGYDNIDMLVAFVTANPTTGMTIGQKWYNTTTKKIFTATSATSGSVTTPEGNEKVYINVATNKSYRWTGSDMVVIGDGSGVALGTTASTAFRGDYGNELYKYMNDNVPPQWGTGTFKRKDALIQAADFFHRIDDDNTPFILCANDPETEPKVETTATKVDVQVGTFVGGTGSSYDQSTRAYFSLGAATTSKAGVMTAAMYQTLQELELQAFPLTLTLSGAGVFEVGQSVKNPIGISVVRKGVNVTSSSTITVTPPSGVTGTLSSTKTIWTPTSNIAANISVSVKADYGAQSQTKSISYTFKRKKYWGVSDKASLTNAEILALAGSGWADARTMGATRFDCTGGKYPYYIIPADKYTGLEVWVGGLKNTDLVVTDLQLTNASGSTAAYKVVRLANKQTGVLSIEFK